MKRTYSSGAAAGAPSVPQSPSHGYATSGNPGNGTPATKPGAWWFHMVTEELVGLIEAAALVPDHESLNQVAAAIFKIVHGGQQVFNASGTFTVPAHVTEIVVEVWGGGGGGAGGQAATNAGPGGGSGGYCVGRFSVAPGAQYTVTVGSAGIGGAATQNGGAGGASSFGALVSATGGGGGLLSNLLYGGSGGSGAGGFETIAGSYGGASFGALSGAGACAPRGGPGPCSEVASNAPSGSAPGGGGAGGGVNAFGGAGGAGRVIVHW